MTENMSGKLKKTSIKHHEQPTMQCACFYGPDAPLYFPGSHEVHTEAPEKECKLQKQQVR